MTTLQRFAELIDEILADNEPTAAEYYNPTRKIQLYSLVCEIKSIAWTCCYRGEARKVCEKAIREADKLRAHHDQTP